MLRTLVVCSQSRALRRQLCKGPSQPPSTRVLGAAVDAADAELQLEPSRIDCAEAAAGAADAAAASAAAAAADDCDCAEDDLLWLELCIGISNGAAIASNKEGGAHAEIIG